MDQNAPAEAISLIVMDAAKAAAMKEAGQLDHLISEWHKHRHGDDAEVSSVWIAIGREKALGVMRIMEGGYELLPDIGDDDALVIGVGPMPLTTHAS